MGRLGFASCEGGLGASGTVAPFEDDLETYRKQLLSGDTPEKPKKPKAARPARPSREKVLALRSEVRKCEDRVSKITEMREKLAKKLADPVLYEDERIDELEVWNRKYVEVSEGLDRAEAMWMRALEKLEAAEA